MITIEKLTKRYGSAAILKNADCLFPETGLVCVTGASGAGKTTLLNLLSGFDQNYEGTIRILNSSLSEMTEAELCRLRNEQIGFVFQSYHLLNGYTALENITLPCLLTEEAKQTAVDRANRLLTAFGLPDKADRKIETLSGGEKQRVAIARALINNPRILFADEPTGALDRSNSTQIMMLLKELSKRRLIVVITHDTKLCGFADEVLHIKNGKLEREPGFLPDNRVSERLEKSAAALLPEGTEADSVPARRSVRTEIGFEPEIGANHKKGHQPRKQNGSFSHILKNFRVHFRRYLAVSLVICAGILAFLFSLSYQNVITASIGNFKEKNTAFNNVSIRRPEDGSLFTLLNNDERLEHVYYQYKIGPVSLSGDGAAVTMEEKLPMPKSSEELSYGVMPRRGRNEIALSPSLAKKFTAQIQTLPGSDLDVSVGAKTYTLTVSGIFNAGYDDFYVSSDVEQQFYEGMDQSDPESISFDIIKFSDIPLIGEELKAMGIDSVSAAAEVAALQESFTSLNRLFLILSVLILVIALFLGSVLLFQLQNSRYHETGLLCAIGFTRKRISAVLLGETSLLAVLAAAADLLFLAVGTLIAKLVDYPLILAPKQIIISLIASFFITAALNHIVSHKLLHTQPADALRK